MSVTLHPLQKAVQSERAESVSICNGHWAALTDLAVAFGDDVKQWDRCHDYQTWTPDELRAIADRVDQISDSASWLRWLADNGGAQLS